MTKQDKAHIKVELLDRNNRILTYYAMLEENGFKQHTQEYDMGKAVRITLRLIERDKAHDYEKEMGFGEDEKRNE